MTIKNINCYKVQFRVKIIEPCCIEDTFIVIENNEIDAAATAISVIEKEYGYMRDSIISLFINKSENAYSGSRDKLDEI